MWVLLERPGNELLRGSVFLAVRSLLSNFAAARGFSERLGVLPNEFLSQENGMVESA
jgi:hypothetical protein